VLGPAEGITTVRLRCASGLVLVLVLVLEDTIDDGLVLFLTDRRVQLPVSAELRDAHGNAVVVHTVL
jgi:hypothetical protein